MWKLLKDHGQRDYGLLDQRAMPRTSRLVMVATILPNLPAYRVRISFFSFGFG